MADIANATRFCSPFRVFTGYPPFLDFRFKTSIPIIGELGAKIVLLNGLQHINGEAGVTELPEALEFFE